MSILYTILALMALVLCIAIISVTAHKRRNKTTQLDDELFRRWDE